MKFDSQGLIVMEAVAFPGSIGDSCAETGRYVTLCKVIGQLTTSDLSAFMTPSGVIRYPTSPWGPTDTSADQVAPLLAAAALTLPTLANTVVEQIKSNGWKTGNKQLINPGLYAMVRKEENGWFQRLTDLAMVGQALIFLIPIRWSDSTHSLERSAGSSADYLNFINFLAFAHAQGKMTWPCKIAMKLVSAKKALAEITSYYASEPNSQWIVDLYEKAITAIWR